MASIKAEDLRVRKTKKALNDAFVSLLREKGFDQLTVNELCDKAEGKEVQFENVERFAFYERAKKAYCIVMTGETALYANIILKKGVVVE